MRRIALSIWTVIAMGSLVFAGGDFKDVEPAVVPVIPITEEDESHLYIGAGVVYNQVYSTDHGFFDKQPTQDETGGFTGIIGYEFNEYVAVEGRYNKTFTERDYSDTTYYSVFLKPQYKFRDDENRDDEDGYFAIYGLLGFGNTQVKGSSGDNDNDHNAWPEDIGRTMMDETGFQWGFGLSYTFVDDEEDDHYTRQDSWSVFADFVMVVDDADITPTKLYDYNPNDPNSADQEYYDKLSVRGFTLGLLYHF